VQRTEPVTPRMVRLTFAGDELEGFTVVKPAASVRLLLPSPGTAELVMPAWNGNEFLLPDGARPIIRTFTPVPGVDGELAVDVVLHGTGAASAWATAANPGAPVALSGPGRGYDVDAAAPAYLLAGDETAIPALKQVLAALPSSTPVHVHIEIAHDDARQPVGGADVQWHLQPGGARTGDALVAAVEHAEFTHETRVWVAGEASAVQRVRKHLFDVRGISRSQTSVRGYWKHGRAGDADEG
jgi:NADPH-dependent ferric siderophore reductase